MKFPSIPHFRQTPRVSIAALLATASAHGALVNTNEFNATHVWTLPTGTNLLSGATTVSAPALSGTPGTGDTTSASWTTVTDGVLGTAGNKLAAVAPLNNLTATFPLNIAVNFNGYTITSLDTYCAWPDGGRDGQNYTVSYSTVDSPATFISIGTVVNRPASGNSTHTRLTDTTGALATRVHSIRFVFTGQENGYTGFREFIALGTAVPLSPPLTWTGAAGSGGSSSWIPGPDGNWKLTDGGAAADFNSLAPLTFDSTGTNPAIAIDPSGITASSIVFSNNSPVAYAFSGGDLTVSNSVAVSGSGNVTFGSPTSVATGLTYSGSGSLTVNGTLTSNGVIVSGSGTVSLNDGNLITGTTVVSGGTLVAGNDAALNDSGLFVSGGLVKFTTSQPFLNSLSGSGGTVELANTILNVGENDDSTSFAGSITNAPGTSGGLLKTGSGTLTLTGSNSYTGVSTVTSGALEFGKPASLYSGNTAAWSATNLVVDAGATLGLLVGGPAEFTSPDVALLSLGGFAPESFLGFNTTSGNFTLDTPVTGSGGLLKSGLNILTLTAANSYSGGTTIVRGAIHAGNPSGISIPGNVKLGTATFNAFLTTTADNQFAPGAVLTFSGGLAAEAAKFQLRGHVQTIGGLDAVAANARTSIVQNDETVAPGYAGPPGVATLTIDAETDHSYYGILRNGDPAAVPALSIVKEGPGTQEFINSVAAPNSYTGPTTINEGMLKLKFSGVNTGFGSEATVNAGGKLGFDGTFLWGNPIFGAGTVVKQGPGSVTFTNGNNIVHSGGTVIEGGTLLIPGTSGEGTAEGHSCALGLMTPTNVVTIESGGTLAFNGIAPLGNSNMLPEFAVSVLVKEGGIVSGGANVGFLPNLTLAGGTLNIGNGSNAGGFGTNLGLVGTVIATGTVPSVITTTGTGVTASASLGSVGLPGTTFQVADVTGDGATDLTVSSILRNVLAVASPLVKTGPGTLLLSAANTYTGSTTVEAGELVLGSASLAEAADVFIAADAKLNLSHGTADTIGALHLGGTQMPAGTYVATGSLAPGIPSDFLKGAGSLVVTVGPSVGYDEWKMVIPNIDDRDREDDPDTDGFTNLEEFIFGTSPIARTALLAASEVSGTDLIIRWNQRSTGGTYVLQESTTLVNPWDTSLVVPAADPEQAGVPSEYTRMRAVVPIDGGKKFIRVEGGEF